MFSRSTRTLSGCGSMQVTFAPGHRSIAIAANAPMFAPRSMTVGGSANSRPGTS